MNDTHAEQLVTFQYVFGHKILANRKYFPLHDIEEDVKEKIF